MFARIGLFFCGAILLIAPGCTKTPEGPLLEQDKVAKVTGKLLINGKPEPQVAVRLKRIGAPDANAKTSHLLTISAFTEADGTFALGTYASGDGAPDGEYAVIFQWGMRNLMGGNYAGDKFGGKYSDPEKSEHKVTVAGQPIDMGVIELTAPEDASFGDTPKAFRNDDKK